MRKRWFALEGDLTRVPVQAIATLINSEGMWFGGIDGAIMNVAGDIYHQVPAHYLKTKGLKDGQVIVAKGSLTNHRGSFDDVIFVVDDLKQPLGKLVYALLQAAHAEGYKKIAIPAMRTGLMFGVVERNLEAVVEQMIKAFDQAKADRIMTMEVYLVIYDDGRTFDLFDRSADRD